MIWGYDILAIEQCMKLNKLLNKTSTLLSAFTAVDYCHGRMYP